MRLNDTEISQALPMLPGWTRKEHALERTLTFDSFPSAIAFIVRLAFAAEAADHHPDIIIHYRQVTITYWTHTEGGITAKDVEGAKALTALVPPGM